MAFFQATGLLGTCNTIAGVLISMRKCYKAQKRIGALVKDSLLSLENIKQVVPQVSWFVEVGGIGLETFCVLAGKIYRIEVDLLKIRERLNKTGLRNKVYRFCSASESTATLESIQSKLSQMESELRLLETSIRSDVKASVLIESLAPLMDAAAEIMPHMDGLAEKNQLLMNVQKAFGTHVLSSRMNRLVAKSTESVYFFIMGKMFFDGMTVEVDYEKSASFFQCAIDYGNSEGFSYLGRQYQGGLGMPSDDRKALKLYMNGAELQDPECLYELGRCFQYGYGVARDGNKQFEYYNKAANVGHVAGQREVGWCLETGIGTEIDLVRSAEYHKAAAEAGDADALCEYGDCFMYGIGVERNVYIAIDLLKIAANAGSTNALVKLGDCYSYGWGVEQDDEDAFCLYNEAADDHDLSGLGRVGQCLVSGYGVAQNAAKGVEILRKAAAAGGSYALNVLAHMYRSGDVVEVDKRKALVSFKRAVRGGDYSANFDIAEMYRAGEGIPVNLRKAIHHFEIFAKYECETSHYNLACIYQREDGYVNENRALYHFRYAADLGHSEARDIVGDYFVSVSGPHKLSFTANELQVLVRNFANNNKTPHVLAQEGLQSAATLDTAVIPDSAYPKNDPPFPGTIDDDDEPPLVPQGSPLGLALSDARLLEIISQKYPNWWMLVCIIVMSLCSNLFMIIKYFFFLYRH